MRFRSCPTALQQGWWVLWVLFDAHHASLNDANEVLHHLAFNDPHWRYVSVVEMQFVDLLVKPHLSRGHGNRDGIGAFWPPEF